MGLNISKTQEMVVDFRRVKFTPLRIGRIPVEKASSYRYLGINISEDQTMDHTHDHPGEESKGEPDSSSTAEELQDLQSAAGRFLPPQ